MTILFKNEINCWLNKSYQKISKLGNEETHAGYYTIATGIPKSCETYEKSAVENGDPLSFRRNGEDDDDDDDDEEESPWINWKTILLRYSLATEFPILTQWSVLF